MERNGWTTGLAAGVLALLLVGCAGDEGGTPPAANAPSATATSPGAPATEAKLATVTLHVKGMT
jgi:hypothetical protein